MEALPTLSELFRMAFASGAVGFTLHSHHHPTVYSAKGVQCYETQVSTVEDIDEMLRRLLNSREVRQFRELGVIHFKCKFESIALIGGAKTDGEDIHVELRKLSA